MYYDESILLGIALDNAVLDIVTTTELLRECLNIIEASWDCIVSSRLGTFGEFAIILSVFHDDTVTIFVDGPAFERPRDQSAGLYLSKADAIRALTAALSAGVVALVPWSRKFSLRTLLVATMRCFRPGADRVVAVITGTGPSVRTE